MIIAVCGTPGSYKSCYAIENFIIPALKKERMVFTNIDGVDDHVSYTSALWDIDPFVVERCLNVLGRRYKEDGTWEEDKDLIRRFYDNLPQNALVVIDEAQNYFSSRDFKEGFSANLIPWLTKSRHVGNDVVWITQNLESVDITFRRNTHLTYSLRRAEHLGFVFKNVSFNYIYDRADTSVRHLARKTYHPDERSFSCYNSYDNRDVKEERKSYNVFLRSPFVWLMIVSFTWLAYALLSGNFQRQVLKQKPKSEKKMDVPIAKGQEEPIQVQQVEVKNEVPERCIVNVSKVHGIAYYNLSDGSSVDSPRGLGYCP